MGVGASSGRSFQRYVVIPCTPVDMVNRLVGVLEGGGVSVVTVGCGSLVCTGCLLFSRRHVCFCSCVDVGVWACSLGPL